MLTRCYVAVSTQGFDATLHLYESLRRNFRAVAQRHAPGTSLLDVVTTNDTDVVISLEQDDKTASGIEGIVSTLKVLTQSDFYIASARAVSLEYNAPLPDRIRLCGLKFNG